MKDYDFFSVQKCSKKNLPKEECMKDCQLLLETQNILLATKRTFFSTGTDYTEEYGNHSNLQFSYTDLERTTELHKMNQALEVEIAERKRIEEELKKHGDHIDELVKERTAELNAANIRLQELDRLKSMFMDSMSHELVTPLNSTIGFISWILMGMEGDLNKEQTKQLTMAKNSANHLLSLIHNILDISMIESGQLDLLIETFEIDEVVNDVAAAILPQAKDKGLELHVDVPERIKLKSDKQRVTQVLMNLASNAVKFTDQGKITIRADASEAGNLEIIVLDNGIGIREEDMDELFKPFQQVDMSSTREHEGTGLGLYLCRKLLDLLHGDIAVKSRYGKGSEFKLNLPL